MINLYELTTVRKEDGEYQRTLRHNGREIEEETEEPNKTIIDNKFRQQLKV